MATYKEIQAYVKKECGFVPKSCWIAHMKEICGLPLRQAPNRHSANKRKVPCPAKKRDAIKKAFVHFNMI